MPDVATESRLIPAHREASCRLRYRAMACAFRRGVQEHHAVLEGTAWAYRTENVRLQCSKLIDGLGRASTIERQKRCPD